MKNRITIIVIVVLIAYTAGTAFVFRKSHPKFTSPVLSALPEARYGKILDSCKADLNNDGKNELVAITYKTVSNGSYLGGYVVVLENTNNGYKLIKAHSNLNPWKIKIVDVDNDKTNEIVLGVWKKSPKDPIFAKRVFIYNFDGKIYHPKWLGSRLSRRFIDFNFKDIDNDKTQELIALEVSPNKPDRVGVYRWKSFGFEWIKNETPDKWEELAK